MRLVASDTHAETIRRPRERPALETRLRPRRWRRIRVSAIERVPRGGPKAWRDDCPGRGRDQAARLLRMSPPKPRAPGPTASSSAVLLATTCSSLGARLGSRVTFMGGDAFARDRRLGGRRAGRGRDVRGDRRAPLAKLGAAGRSFARSFRRGESRSDVPSYVVEAAQATEVVLQAIARSDGTRASVLKEMRATKVDDGILGSFRFDRNGDISPTPVSIYRIAGRSASRRCLHDVRSAVATARGRVQGWSTGAGRRRAAGLRPARRGTAAVLDAVAELVRRDERHGIERRAGVGHSRLVAELEVDA